MANNSRIRFNPVTKEIEVEGTEQFVKTYFAKLQAMLSGASEKKRHQERTESRKGTSSEEVQKGCKEGTRQKENYQSGFGDRAYPGKHRGNIHR